MFEDNGTNGVMFEGSGVNWVTTILVIFEESGINWIIFEDDYTDQAMFEDLCTNSTNRIMLK